MGAPPPSLPRRLREDARARGVKSSRERAEAIPAAVEDSRSTTPLGDSPPRVARSTGIGCRDGVVRDGVRRVVRPVVRSLRRGRPWVDDARRRDDRPDSGRGYRSAGHSRDRDRADRPRRHHARAPRDVSTGSSTQPASRGRTRAGVGGIGQLIRRCRLASTVGSGPSR